MSKTDDDFLRNHQEEHGTMLAIARASELEGKHEEAAAIREIAAAWERIAEKVRRASRKRGDDDGR